jgi:hypothetical protein
MWTECGRRAGGVHPCRAREPCIPADVTVPVRWWHGITDHIVPIAGGEAAVSGLQDAELLLVSGQGRFSASVLRPLRPRHLWRQNQLS